MSFGELLGGRFRLEALAAAGGMGKVYRALDLATVEPVAVKVLLDSSSQHLGQLQHEAELLRSVSHPGIVRYVAYDASPGRQAFLAMEWLDGEDLSELLKRRRLTVAEVVELGKRVAEALAAAHARGVIHRDLKPRNIYLVGGRTDEPKLLDFGIAHLAGVTLADDEALMGTPGYMAPEQARSGDTIGAPADVFSLGCVLFECLTGVHPFQADHPIALLARIIFDEPSRVREICPEVPPWLDALVMQMLAKDPSRRPRDGAAVAAALAAEEAPETPVSSKSMLSITGWERRFLGVVVVGRPPAPAAPDVTLCVTVAGPALEEVQRVAAEYGGRLEMLADGTMVIIISGPTVPTDIAVQLARCALALEAHFPERRIAVTTGWGKLGRGLPVGAAIERAMKLLREAEVGEPHITLDEQTAGLIDARFDIAGFEEGRLELRGERVLDEVWRPLLGRPTPCVGRDDELQVLQQAWARCAAGAAQVVLITGPAGMGKSRLIQELVERVRRSGEAAAIWIGRGDPLRADSTSGLLAEAIRGAAGLRGGEPLELRREQLRARVGRHVPERHRQRVSEFLGELVGIPFPDDDRLPLRAARQDPALLGEQMQRALRDFLRAECGAQPVLLVLENVHWGDRASMGFIEAALRGLEDQPLMVLASARPEIEAVFPRLWEGCGRVDVRLRQLSPRAGARLARQALGEAADEPLIQRLVAQSEGHPFFLEELIRAAAEGRGAVLPETVVAMVQVRLEGLEPGVRRALRAASVLGEVFWRGALLPLLGLGASGPGSARHARTVDDCLQALLDQELCVKHRESRFPGQEEYAFRQTLLREGAYALLTEEDRELGHRLAGEWLERAGEADPVVLAGHYERGGLGILAADLYLRGAELASARLAYLDAERCYARASELMGGLPLAARRGRGLSRFRLGHHEDALADMAAAREQAAEAKDTAAEVEILLDEAMILDWMGEYRGAEERVSSAQERAAAVTSPRIKARLHLGAGRTLHRADREKEAAALLTCAADLASGLGDEGYETHVIALLLLGFILPNLGRTEDAARALDEVIRQCEERSDLLHLGAALNNRALVRAYRGDREGMVADFEHTIALGRELGQPMLELGGHFNLAEYLYLMDDVAAAEPHAQAAAAVASRCGSRYRPPVLALQGRLRLYQGDVAGAREAAAEVRAYQNDTQARGDAADEALSPSEDVLCAMIELATAECEDAAWDALEACSAVCSVGQERIEVLEARALAALRRGLFAQARQQLGKALIASGKIPNVMEGRLRRWLAEAERQAG